MRQPSRASLALLVLCGLALTGGLTAATSPTPFNQTTQPRVHVQAQAPLGVNLSQYQPRQYVRSSTPNTSITITSMGPQHLTGQLSTPGNASTTLYVRTTVSGYHPHPLFLYYRGRQPALATVQAANHSWYRVTLNTTSTPRGFVVRTSRKPSHQGPASVHANVSFNHTQPAQAHGVSQGSVRAGRSDVHVAEVHASTGNVQYAVNSSQHAGTTLYLKASTLNASLHAPLSAVSARLDGSPVQFGLTTQKGATWVVVNIPHFSAHNLEFAVTSSGSTSQSSPGILTTLTTNPLYLAAGAAVILVLAILVLGL